MKQTIKCLVAAFAAMLVAVSAFAQITTSSLGGRVTDANGEHVIGAADVATGKTFHLANGEQATGTNTGGITPTGTLNITANGVYDVTSYASADVDVDMPAEEAYFPEIVSLTITLDNYLDVDQTFDLEVYFRGPDVDDPTKVVWRNETFNFSGTDNSDTHIINLVANPDGQYKDGVYIPVGDGGGTSNITSAVNCAPRYVTDNGTTGSEQVYLTINGNNASCVVYYSTL